MVSHYEGITAWLTAAIERGKRSGEMDPALPTATVVERTIATMDGLQILWFARGTEVDMVADFAEYVEELHDRWATAVSEAAG